MAIFGISLILYFFLHSLLAADGVKASLMRGFVPERYYRLIYSGLAIGLLVPLVLLFQNIEPVPLWESDDDLRWLPAGLLMLGGSVWMFRALKGYGFGEFIGLQQLQTGKPPVPSQLKVDGLNRRVRHPLMFGMLQVMVALLFLFPTQAMLLATGISVVYMFIGAKLEEQKLRRQFGEAYHLYKERVPMLVPFKFGRSRD